MRIQAARWVYLTITEPPGHTRFPLQTLLGTIYNPEECCTSKHQVGQKCFIPCAWKGVKHAHVFEMPVLVCSLKYVSQTLALNCITYVL